jgi:hypothetical protein
MFKILNIIDNNAGIAPFATCSKQKKASFCDCPKKCMTSRGQSQKLAFFFLFIYIILLLSRNSVQYKQANCHIPPAISISGCHLSLWKALTCTHQLHF